MGEPSTLRRQADALLLELQGRIAVHECEEARRRSVRFPFDSSEFLRAEELAEYCSAEWRETLRKFSLLVDRAQEWGRDGSDRGL